MSRILLFSRDPGGANTVIPLVRPLVERGHVVRLYGKDVALSKYRQQGLEGMDVTVALHAGVTPEGVRALLEDEAADMVITGTSADDFTEKYLWKEAEKFGVPSMAILDQWLVYGIRFSPYTVMEMAEYGRNPIHPFLPTRIVAPDDCARSEMVAEGLPAERIVACGQPYFQTVLASRQDTAAVADFRRQHGLDGEEFVVVFASEPIVSTFGEAFWGYSQLTILAAVLRALTAASRATGRKVALVARPHPKEGCEHFLPLLRQHPELRSFFDQQASPWTLMNAADLVCGMSSMFLIEAAILERPVLSVQIGLCRENPLVLDRRGVLKSVLSEDELQRQVLARLSGEGGATQHFAVIGNAAERIISEMERLICQSSH